MPSHKNTTYPAQTSTHEAQSPSLCGLLRHPVPSSIAMANIVSSSLHQRTSWWQWQRCLIPKWGMRHGSASWCLCLLVGGGGRNGWFCCWSFFKNNTIVWLQVCEYRRACFKIHAWLFGWAMGVWPNRCSVLAWMHPSLGHRKCRTCRWWWWEGSKSMWEVACHPIGSHKQNEAILLGHW